jgi:hypothetical protein
MSNTIEDLIASEAVRQGVKINVEGMRRAVIDIAGSTLTADRMIAMPGKGSISPADFVRSLRTAMPEGFAPVTDKPASSHEQRPGETLTAFMRRQVEAGRRQPQLPDDWDQVRSRYTGLTASMMDSIKKSKYGK